MTGDAGARGARLPVVVLGASNVSRGLARLAAAVRGRAAGPVDLYVAAGHGRSYGANSRVWMRRLPSILWSGLWRGIERALVTGDRPQGRALVTDIGNDLLYGFEVEQVAAWVDECLRRFSALGIDAVVTRLPLASIRGVGRMRFSVLRSLYVPGCRLDLDELVKRAESLDRMIVELAAAHGRAVIEQPANWYGLDALHIRRCRLPDLWNRVADAWGLVAGVSAGQRLDRLRLGLAAAEVRSLGGFIRYTPQPAVQLGDLATVSFF